MVDALRAELIAAGRLNSSQGQLALVLASLLETATGSALVAVSRELRAVRERALGSSVPPTDDLLDELKRRRDGEVQGTRGRPA